MSARRIVITGVGAASPLATSADEHWRLLCEGKEGVRRLASFDPGGFPSHIGGEAPQFKINQLVPKTYRKATKVMARDIELAVVAADDAVKNSGLITRAVNPDTPKVDPARLSVNIGAGLIPCEMTEMGQAIRHALDGQGRFDIRKWGLVGLDNLTPLWLLKYLPNMPSCHVGIIHDAQGPSNAITCAEVSGLLALGESWRMLAENRADVAFAGGAESKTNPMGLLRPCQLELVTIRSNARPKKAVRPFDQDRAGTAVAEGAGILVLEELKHAQKRGAKILAELFGFGAANDPTPAPQRSRQGRGMQLAIEAALREAGLKPIEVNVLIALGLGHGELDLSEAQGIRAAFRGFPVPVLGLRGQMGNMGAGSGALDLVAAVKMLEQQKSPYTVNCESPCPDCGLNIVSREKKPKQLENAMVVGYSLAGQYAAVVLIRWQKNHLTH